MSIAKHFTEKIANGAGGGNGPIATEEVTFKVVEVFETNQQPPRFLIPVSHLHGADGFGCDYISVASQ